MTRGAAGGSGEAGMFPGPPVARQLSRLSPRFWGAGGTPACRKGPHRARLFSAAAPGRAQRLWRGADSRGLPSSPAAPAPSDPTRLRVIVCWPGGDISIEIPL